jgi:hypothetical protein
MATKKSKKSALKSRSGPSLTEERRVEKGQLRINLRLDAEPVEALRRLTLPGEGPTAVISRVLIAASPRPQK